MADSCFYVMIVIQKQFLNIYLLELSIIIKRENFWYQDNA